MYSLGLGEAARELPSYNPGVRVLGLDPGSAHTGWGVVEHAGARLVARAWGRLSPDRRLALPERLRQIAAGVEALLAEHAPDAVALERVFHGVNSRSLIVLAEARGAILAALGGHALELVEVTPATVKSAVAGDGSADKQRVARLVRSQLALGEAALAADASDALAVAIAGGHLLRRGAAASR